MERMEEARISSVESRRRRQKQHDQQVRPVIERLAKKGLGLGSIANNLNTMGIPAPRGGKWHGVQVSRVMVRLSLDTMQPTANSSWSHVCSVVVVVVLMIAVSMFGSKSPFDLAEESNDLLAIFTNNPTQTKKVAALEAVRENPDASFAGFFNLAKKLYNLTAIVTDNSTKTEEVAALEAARETVVAGIEALEAKGYCGGGGCRRRSRGQGFRGGDRRGNRGPRKHWRGSRRGCEDSQQRRIRRDPNRALCG